MSHRSARALPIGTRSSRAGWRLASALVVAALTATAALDAGVLMTVNTPAASPGVAIQITGTGFSTIASQNILTITPTSGAEPRSAAATAVTTLDATRGIRRLNVTVPAAMPAGSATLRVTNSATGEISEGLSFEVVQISLPSTASGQPGAIGLPVVITGSANARFTADGTTRVAFGSGVAVRTVTVEGPQRLTAIVDIAAAATLGGRAVAVRPPNQSLLLVDGFTVSAAPPANRAPRITSTPVLAARVGETYTYQPQAIDDDGDAVVFGLERFPDGMTIDTADGAISWSPQASQVGIQAVTVRASDTRGGSGTQSFDIQVAPAAITAITLAPAHVRFSTPGDTRPLTVTGLRSDGSVVDLTSGAAGTTYESSNTFVASVSADGLLTARASGDTTVTARHLALASTAAVVVEIGVTLESLELSPALSTLRSAGATAALVLHGRFSDGTVRDLTTAAGTAFRAADEAVASVDGSGLITAVAAGVTTITATHDSRTASAEVRVVIADGQGFVRGQVFDDSQGLPLANAVVTLVSDGGGPYEQPPVTSSDERGRFVLPARSGDVLVRVGKDSFTSVERRATLPNAGVVRLLDARLTPLGTPSAIVRSALGGQVHDGAGIVGVDVPPGALPSDAALSITPISAQGLAGRLPLGWSAVYAVEVSPRTALFQPATVTVPNSATLTPGTPVAAVVYDASAHAWTSIGAAQLAGDGRTMTVTIATTGQFALVVGDGAPFEPPVPIVGQPLAGVDGVRLPAIVEASGTVVPRSAPPGEGARAVGRIGLASAEPLPSGTAVLVHVSETFDLLDTTRVVPPGFTQDIILHARPRPPSGSALAASFAITPSRAYTIQELMHGVVALDVTRPSTVADGTVVDAAGGTVSSEEGDALIVPAAALSSSALLRLERVPGASLPAAAPAGYQLLSALEVDAVGVTFAVPARLSIARPVAVLDTDQVLVAQAFVDPLGVQRLRIVGTGDIEGDRLVSGHTGTALPFAGVTVGAQYLFIKVDAPVGFLTGVVNGPDGATPAAPVLLTADTAPFADVTGSSGRYLVAGRAGATTRVAATHLVTRDVAEAMVEVPSRGDLVTLSLSLAVSAPRVIATNPAAGAVNVPLDSSIAIDFSASIDPASITDQSVGLQIAGAPVSVTRVLSQDRRRLTLRPATPLQGRATFTIVVTSDVRDLTGTPLEPFANSTFSTLDPTRPPQPPPGQITASLPDAGGLVIVVGTAGAAESRSAVTATNLRTQETTTVVALEDGSFRLWIGALIGDEIALTLRDGSGRETTVAITQFEGEGGATAIGGPGGVIGGAAGRVGTILPRALVAPGIFRLAESGSTSALPLPAPFSYADRFALAIEGGEFNRVASLTLTESQARFESAIATRAPFTVAGELTVPSDFLTNGAIRYAAVAQDALGARRSATAQTVVVAASPDRSEAETAHTADFPTLFVTAPRESVANQVTGTRAETPAARIDLSIPAPPPQPGADIFLLTRLVTFGAEDRLAVVDRLVREGTALRSAGRAYPGMSSAGEYAIVASSEPLALVTGRMSGPAGLVAVEGLPFVSEGDGANASFILPVRADEPFTLRFHNADGSIRGTISGQAPAEGTVDVGDPLAAAAGGLRVTSAEPESGSTVDVDRPIVVRFSEAIDPRTAGASGIVVTDGSGARIYGSTNVSEDGMALTFRPTRRWRYATTYRYGVSTTILARSGARLAQPFHGELTTFAPAVLSATGQEPTFDIAVSGTLALAGTSSAATLLDVSATGPYPTLGSRTSVGAARALAFVPPQTITDRGGQVVSGNLAVVASGGSGAEGRLEVLDVTNASAPALLGSATLTPSSGPSGIPVDIAVTTDGRALIAVEDVGLLAVRVGQLIPDDPDGAAPAIAGRYPATGSESVTGVALLGTRVVAAGAAGLTVLDPVSFERRGGVASGTGLRDVDALASFSMDLNGDGSIAAATEIFDLAVAAGGADGTIQFFRVPENGDPVLLSVVRFDGQTTSVVLNRTERLAYVGLGERGMAIVDLDGPVSVQPLDIDRNGVDDRTLFLLRTESRTQRVTLDTARGVAYLAGASGFTSVQVVPARVRILSIRRDPVPGFAGDEELLAEPGQAYVTDTALVVSVAATAPPGRTVTLALEEAPSSGPRTLAFEAGSLVNTLSAGVTDVRISIAPGGAGGHASIVARDDRGAALGRRAVRLVEPPAGTALRAIFAAPTQVVLGDAVDRAPLAVGGVLDDGRVINVTTAASQTRYVSANQHVAEVDQDGEVQAVGGGRTGVEVYNGALASSVAVRVNRPAVLVGLRAAAPVLTLITSASQALAFTARFSDGSERPASDVAGTVFTTSDANVVGVDSAGRASAVADGIATVRAANAGFEAGIEVQVELRGATSVASIDLAPFTSRVTTDDATIDASVGLTGTGSLHGLTVTYVLSSGSEARAVTGPGGTAAASLGRVSVAGQYTVTASVQDPATGTVRTDSEPLTVSPGTSDSEPNDSDATAATLNPGVNLSGSLTAATDSRDTFRVDAFTSGRLELDLHLLDGTAPADLVIVVRDAEGRELLRITPTDGRPSIVVDIPAGGAIVSVELAGQSARYSLAAKVVQGPVAIDAVAPPSGPPGTTVVISGSGFSARTFENAVFFGAVRGKLIASSPTRLEVVVPINAVDGNLRVVAAARGATGPAFAVGNAGPLAPAFTRPPNPSNRRHDPVSGAVVDVTRLWVDFDATTTRARVDQIVTGSGGNVAGFIPILNRYLIEFPANTTLAGLRGREAAMAVLPDVVRVSLVDFPTLQSDRSIDARDRSGSWSNGAARADTLDRVRLFEAIEAVRRTDPFRNPFNLRRVKIGVIDSGWAPTVASEFPATVRVFGSIGAGLLTPVARQDVGFGHGTAVSGIIAAVNDGSPVSGVLGSLLRQDESPFWSTLVDLTVYACGLPGGTSVDNACIQNALNHIISESNFDVVNMSLRSVDYASRLAEPGCPGAGLVYTGAGKRCEYYWLLQPLVDRTLVVVAAGNDGVGAGNTFPAVLERDLGNVISIGAVAVSNEDGTGEGKDERAVLNTALRTPSHAGERDCRGGSPTPPPHEASNCGPGVSMAAPGEDHWTTGSSPGMVGGIATNLDYRYFNGSSSAAPLVAGVAAMLQSIRPSAAIIPPAVLKATLIETADDISTTWQSSFNEPMVRLNALSAVRRILPSVTQQRIFVTDHAEGAPSGHVVALNVDPLTGIVSGTAMEIPLEFSNGGATVTGSRPAAILTAPPGDWAFVLASTDQPDGDGIFVLNTTALEVENFIPLSGRPFPDPGTVPVLLPARLSTRSPMVAAANGRVLFVAAGSRIFVVDTLTHRVVGNLDQLTWSGDVTRPIPSTLLALRGEGFRQAVRAAEGEITSLSLSPDNRTLYALVQTGVGTGFQPGFLMEIDVALDVDRDPTTSSLEPDLDNFFQLKGDPERITGHDEPSAVAASPNGRYVYIANGGVQAFTAVVPGHEGFISSLLAFAADMLSAPQVNPTVADLAEREGYTQLLAGGHVQAFDVQAGNIAGEVWRFPSEVSVSWTPSSPVISDQVVRSEINSERTYGMAFRYDGRRALVPFFQTGNFGVLDLVGQEFQPQAAPPGPFQGLVAVTPSLRLDASLWPAPADEPRLFASALTYAQNGRFAAAIHTGVHGGALTIIDDNQITSDLATHLAEQIPNPSGAGTVPFYSVRPLCAERNGPTPNQCSADVSTTLTEYPVAGGSGTAPFSRPRGVAIQPFVNIVHPGSGDRTSASGSINFSWRDGRAVRYEILVFDLGHVSFNTPPPDAPIGPPREGAFDAQERDIQYAVRSISWLFPIGSPPRDNHRYRIQVRVMASGGEEIGVESVTVVFRQ